MYPEIGKIMKRLQGWQLWVSTHETGRRDLSRKKSCLATNAVARLTGRSRVTYSHTSRDWQRMQHRTKLLQNEL